MFDFKSFPRNLIRWSINVSACALPSFLIALITGFHSPAAIVAMLCGIATFVLIYALATSTRFYQNRRDGLLGQALRVGTRVRMIISLISLPLILGFFFKMPMLLQMMLDFWCGYLAIFLLEWLDIFRMTNPGGNFLSTYAVTVVEGVIVSATLAVICLLALWPISMRDPREYGSD